MNKHSKAGKSCCGNKYRATSFSSTKTDLRRELDLSGTN